jgi:predicted ATPase
MQSSPHYESLRDRFFSIFVEAQRLTAEESNQQLVILKLVDELKETKRKLELFENRKQNELFTLKEANRKMAELLKTLAEHESCSCSKNKSEM